MTKVFLSSVIVGMEVMRDAAAAACDSLDHECLRAETLPASAGTPQGACLQLVRDADAVVLLLGPRYGAIQRSGKSATEEEFDEATRLGKSVFVFCTAIEFEPSQSAFRDRVGAWQGGQLYKTCDSPTAVQREVTRALRAWGTAPSTVEVDEVVKQNFSRVVLSTPRGVFIPGGPWVAASWAPSQRPHLEEEFVFEQLPRVLGDLLVAGERRLVDRRPQTTNRKDGVEAVVRERNSTLSLAAWVGLDGSIAVGCEVISATPANQSGSINSAFFLPPKELERTLGNQLGFISGLLDAIDSARSVTSGRWQAGLARMGMRHLSEPFTKNGGVPIPMSSVTGDRDRAVIVPTQPETVVRSQLGASGQLTARCVARFVRAYGEEDGQTVR